MIISATTILIFIFLMFLVHYHWSRRKLYILASKFTGPLALPIVGNAYQFIGNPEDVLMKINTIVSFYESTNNMPFRFWLGPNLLIVFYDPKHVEKILSSTKVTYKHDVYDFMKPYAGEGLITGSGPPWKMARKLIQPIYNSKFVSDSVRIFQQHIDICVKKLEKFVDQDFFNVEPINHKCSADIIGEVILGYQLNTQNGQNQEFMRMFIDCYDIVYRRIIKPWLHPNFIYNLTKYKKIQDKHVGFISEYFKNIRRIGMNAYLKKIPLQITDEKNFEPSLIPLSEKFYNNKTDIINEELLKDNLITLYAASEDTMTAIASSACVCFGMYPEYQEIAAKEIRSVIGDQFHSITYEDISKFTFLDMCVKDVLRLFPIAPYIIRKTTENFQIDQWTIPPNCALVIPIFNLHLNPKFWEKPMDFYPNHFQAEAVKNRPTFSYIPFSAGPRGCIGKLFAQTSIKVLLASILYRYVIEADGKYPDIYKQLKADISVRPKCGYNIKIKRRIWT